MTGLFMLALTGVWLVIVALLSRWIGRKFKQTTAQAIVSVLSFAVLLPLPVADELIGARQFEALCREGAVLKIDAEKIRGKRVKTDITSFGKVAGTAIPVMYSRLLYRDEITNEVLGGYTTYSAKGGWLIRSLGVFDNNAPLLIGKPGCSPQGHTGTFAKQYGFVAIN